MGSNNEIATKSRNFPVEVAPEDSKEDILNKVGEEFARAEDWLQQMCKRS